MKKIGSIKMHDADLMSNDEMKRIVGGDLPTTTYSSCSVTCPEGGKVEITRCDGRCISDNEKHMVMCDGINNRIEKYCPGYKPEPVL